MSELHPYVGITDIEGGRKMEKCVRNISHYGDWSCSSFFKKQIIFPLDVNSYLHSVNIYQRVMYFSGSEIACGHGYFLFTEKHGLSGRKYIHLPYKLKIIINCSLH